MSQSLLLKLTVTHRTWSTFYFVLSDPTLFLLVKLPTVLGFDLAITNNHSIKHNFYGYPVAMHFNEQSHTIEDLRCIIIKNHVPDMEKKN